MMFVTDEAHEVNFEKLNTHLENMVMTQSYWLLDLENMILTPS